MLSNTSIVALLAAGGKGGLDNKKNPALKLESGAE